MTINIIAFIILITGWVLNRLQKDYFSGMRLLIGLLVFLPEELRLPVPSGLPQVTIHRILIVLAFIFVAKNRDRTKVRPRSGLMPFIVLFGVAQILSLIFGTEFVSGLKGCFNYWIEVAAYFLVIREYVETEPEPIKLVMSICYWLAGVALIGTLEKYKGIDLVALVLGLPPGDLQDVASTYPHRILFGYAMTIGATLALSISTVLEDKKLRRRAYIMALLGIAADYFSMSRGPWVGLGLAMAGVMVFGDSKLRKKIPQIAILTVAVLVIKPGVWYTIHDLVMATFDADSGKGSSYQTRWQLWGIARQEVAKSPVRVMFGYGPGSTEHMDLSMYFYGEEGWSSSMQKLGYTSWDNNYACDFIELGVFGFVAEGILLAVVLKLLITNRRKAHPDEIGLHTGILVSCLVFMYALTNVFMFSPQLKYLFWALVAMAENFQYRSLAPAGEEGDRALQEEQVIYQT